jgi:hypothetical protein
MSAPLPSPAPPPFEVMEQDCVPPYQLGAAAGRWQPRDNRLNYTHDALIDAILANPHLRQKDFAEMFSRTPQWVHLVMASDAFKARLAERKAQIVDPILGVTTENRLEAVANASLEKLLDKLSNPAAVPSDDFVLQSAKMATSAMGYGARVQPGGQTNVAVIVQVPPKSASAEEWAQAHTPRIEASE